MIIWQIGCVVGTVGELGIVVRGLPATWLPPWLYFGTMDDQVWEVEHTGGAAGGGELFTRSVARDVGMNGRSFVKGELTLTAWTLKGDRGAYGYDPAIGLARYLGYAYHVRERMYLLPGSAGVSL